MRIYNFTHTDLDGVGSGLLIENFFGKENVTVSENNYNEIVDNVNKFINSGDYKNYDLIFMTDLSVPDESTVSKIDSFFGEKFVLLDHHSTAVWQNKYKWSYVRETSGNKKTSGTSLVMWFLLKNKDVFYNKGVKPLNNTTLKNMVDYAELVRMYDCWEWDELDVPYEPASDYNDFFYSIGKTGFKDFVHSVNFSTEIKPEYDVQIKNKKEILKRYASQKDKEIKGSILKTENGDFNIGFIYVDMNFDVSKLGNMLSRMNPNYDGIGMLTVENKKLSFRTRNEVDLTPVAKLFGGGGHPKACAAVVEDMSLLLSILDGKPKYNFNQLMGLPKNKHILEHDDINKSRIYRLSVLLDEIKSKCPDDVRESLANVFVNRYGLCVKTNESETYVFNYKGIAYINPSLPKIDILKYYSEKDRVSGTNKKDWLIQNIYYRNYGLNELKVNVLKEIFNKAYDQRIAIVDKNGNKIKKVSKI